MRHTINLDCKTHHVSKDGTFPILLRVSLNGEQDYFNIGKRIKSSEYDKEKKAIKKGIKGAGGYEKIIDLHKVRIQNIIDDFDKKGELASITRLKEVYLNDTNGSKSKCFYEFVGSRIAWEKIHTKIKKNTFKFIEANLEKLQKYKKKLSIHDITEDFIDGYKAYLTNTLGQKPNTVLHAVSFIRKYTKQLYKEGKITRNPFDNYKVGSPFEAALVYLEPEELKALHDLYDSEELLTIVKPKSSKYARDFEIGKKYQEVLRYFLVACYTGFRHSDIKTLKREHIVGNEIVKQLIKGSVGREKTVRIPIQDCFYSLMNMDNPDKLLFENPVMEDSQTNKYLREIMKIACIEKKITFHKARYSFAINSLILKVDIVVISNILGHSELTTTQRYAKVVDKFRNNEIGKWGGFRNKVNSNEIIISCSNCNHFLLKSEHGIINQKHIKCVCPNCTTLTVFDFKKNEVVCD
jgi:site-specific recombinase XerD/phage FluMu protein Com